MTILLNKREETMFIRRDRKTNLEYRFPSPLFMDCKYLRSPHSRRQSGIPKFPSILGQRRKFHEYTDELECRQGTLFILTRTTYSCDSDSSSLTLLLPLDGFQRGPHRPSLRPGWTDVPRHLWLPSSIRNAHLLVVIVSQVIGK